MRDIVRHYASATPGAAARILEDAGNPLRETYLLRFVDQEGRVFTNRFYQRHKKFTPAKMAEELYARTHGNPRRFTSVFRYLEPRASYEQYVTALHAQIPASKSLAPRVLESMYKSHAPDAYNLADRGYVTQIHPLELWVVKTMRATPKTDLNALYKQGTEERRDVYNWLFKTSRKNAQDIRIQSLLEVEAFDALLTDWKRVGYPFDNITPSYATAIGSSGDRPAALAELMSILLNNGLSIPMTSLTQLHFAADTPYETRLSPKAPRGERLIPAEVAQTVRRALLRVVESGTAARLSGALKDASGQTIRIGGKTGTGDHRFERFGKGGQLLESRVVNRTATFVFYLGDQYFGTLTALVPGEQAGQFGFTSSLTAQILKTLLPKLQPHLQFRSAAPEIPQPGAKPSVVPPPAAPKKPMQEKPDGATSQAAPPAEEPPAKSGVPNDMEPGAVMPMPAKPPPPPAIAPQSPKTPAATAAVPSPVKLPAVLPPPAAAPAAPPPPIWPDP